MTSSTLMEGVAELLQRTWGYESLRPLQREVIEATLLGRDAVVVMPTGGGKSLCFQVPALVDQRLTVVVSPLIALMKDQVDALEIVGVAAAALNSSLSSEEEQEVVERLRSGRLRLLYVSPERLLTPLTLQLLRESDEGRGPARFAIDEAHCISAWGHDFRPEFRQLSKIKETFPGVPIQAFTATATPRVQKDIAVQLRLERPKLFVGVFDRPNLTYRVVAKEDKLSSILETIRRYPDEGAIVYCLSRANTETLAKALVKSGIPAVAYHAGLAAEDRKKISEDFAQERTNVVVATIAFGMGIDRANVRCVIHDSMPKSMEGYVQETGRAGRDGMPSECLLLYSASDLIRLKRFFRDMDESTRQHHEALLEEVRRFAQSTQCRHQALSRYFGQDYDLPEEGCGACDVCLGAFTPVPDGDEQARRILRALLEVESKGRTCGVAFLSEVLVGKTTKTVQARGGDQLAEYGAIRGEHKQRVALWIGLMIEMGLIEVTSGEYPTLAVTDRGRSDLADQAPIALVENKAMVPTEESGRRRDRRRSAEELGPADEGLFTRLRHWRREIAEKRGVPAFVVMHDSTLMHLAALRPTTVQQLLAVPGMGERRVEALGPRLVQVISEFCSQHGLAKGTIAEAPAAPSPPDGIASDVYDPLFRKGTSIDQVARELGIKHSTAYDRLAEWIEHARPRSITGWVDPETRTRVEAALEGMDTSRLKPAFEALNGEVPYEVLRVVATFMRARSPLCPDPWSETP